MSKQGITKTERAEADFFRRIPQIDYLRALAVLGVIANHVLGVPGGFIGVDVFFVVSGFVITLLILGDVDRGRFSFVGFYGHRVARILPPLIVVMIFIYGCAKTIFLLPEDYGFIRDSWPYQAAFIQNFMYAQWATDYFQGLTAAKINLHLWSLAVEEQFYLVYPVLLIIIIRFRKSWLMRIMVAILLASSFLLLTDFFESEVAPALAVLLAMGGEDVSTKGMRYYLLIARIWELASGAIACVLAKWFWSDSGASGQSHRLWPKVATTICFVTVLASMVTIDGTMAWPDARALIPVLATSVILFLLARYGSEAMPLKIEIPVLGAIGRSSYSLYLWHWPVLGVFLYTNRDFGVSWFDYAIYVLIIGGLTAFTYVLIESRRHLISGPVPSALVLILFVGLCFVFWSDRRDSQELPAQVRQIIETGAYSERCQRCVATPNGPFVVLWGDSHSRMILQAVEHVSSDYGYQLVHIPGSLADSHDHLKSLVARPEYRGVVLASRWSMYAIGFPADEPEETGHRYLPLEGVVPDNKAMAIEHFSAHLRRLVDVVQAGPVVFMIEVPRYPFFPKKEAVMEWLGLRARALPTLTINSHRASQAELNAVLSTVLPQVAEFKVLDPSDTLCRSGVCAWRDGFNLYYKDDDHLSVYGARLLVPYLHRAFAKFINE